jgi:tetratricopeptide (TPR) repeat protein
MPLRILACLVALAAASLAAAPLDEARALIKEKKYPEAAALLEKVIAVEPNNAAACHELGLVLRRRNDDAAFEQAVKWLSRAVELEPRNATYLADFGGTSMELAGRNRSLSAATRGRDAMEKSLTLNPDNVDARVGLFQFYTRAPWPLGSSSKAAAQLAEIAKRDPDRATVLSVLAKANAHDFAGAFKLCDDVLARAPDNYTALYQYGRTASASGQNLQRGLACLQRCIALAQPDDPTAPTHAHAWYRIGSIQEQLGHAAEARAAYESALKLDPHNTAAADALAKLK